MSTRQPCRDVWETQGYESNAACCNDPANPKAGSMVDFMRDIAAEAHFTYERVDIRQKSFDGSSFTGCVHAVALNET